MTRATVVTEVRVADPSLWSQLVSAEDIDALLLPTEDPCVRWATPAFEKQHLPSLGSRVLVRFARAEGPPPPATDLDARVDALPPRARALLTQVLRHAVGGEVVGLHTWDPERQIDEVRQLVVMGLLHALPGDPPLLGRYLVHPDLPAPPPLDLSFADAMMPVPDDLPPAGVGPAAILQDAASLAACLHRVQPRRVLSGAWNKVDERKLGAALGLPTISRGGSFDGDARWSRALRALEALGAVSMDPMDRVVRIDLALEGTLAGATTDAVHRFVEKVVERDLHPLLPILRQLLAQAGGRAVDEVVFLDELRLQHREVLHPSWLRAGVRVYPYLPEETPQRFDDDGWDTVEVPEVQRLLRLLTRVGLIRRGGGVFAATDDGRHWAESHDGPHPPIWVGSDLEVIIPPNALTPWERFLIERLGQCVARDVTDRIRLERERFLDWLSVHDAAEALELLERKAPGLPRNVVETLRTWERTAMQVVLTRGVRYYG